MKHLKTKSNSKATAARTIATFLLIATILIVAAGVSSMPLPAQAFIDPTTVDRTEPKAPAVISGENVYIVWWTDKGTVNGNGEVMFRASSDGGATFGDKINLSNTTNADSIDAEISAEGENVIVTWWERNQTSGEIPVARVSNDAGATFGPMLMLGMNGTISGIEEGEEATAGATEEGGEGEGEGDIAEGVIEEAVGGTEVAE